jgi:hypothetical protein
VRSNHPQYILWSRLRRTTEESLYYRAWKIPSHVQQSQLKLRLQEGRFAEPSLQLIGGEQLPEGRPLYLLASRAVVITCGGHRDFLGSGSRVPYLNLALGSRDCLLLSRDSAGLPSDCFALGTTITKGQPRGHVISDTSAAPQKTTHLFPYFHIYAPPFLSPTWLADCSRMPSTA